LKFIIQLLILALMLTTLSACSGQPGIDSYQLIILNDSWDDLQLGYEAKQAFPILINVNTSNCLYVIKQQEVEQYDWDTQVITLTEEATTELIKALSNATYGKEDTLINMYKKHGYSNALESGLYIKTFIVKVNDHPLYGGIVLNATSQMPIDYPVLRISMVENKARITVLPVHIPFVMNDPMYSDELIASESKTIGIEEIPTFLADLIMNVSSSESANEFRLLIRDERIRTLFQEVGKIK
jgi:hypothetical protein